MKNVLVDGLHVKWLMVGDDFCYGARRAGNVAMLMEAGQRYGFEVVDAAHGDATASSAFPRRPCAQALAAGDFDHARAAARPRLYDVRAT